MHLFQFFESCKIHQCYAICLIQQEKYMATIEVYTRSGCGYCDHAKAILDSKRLSYEEYNVYEQPEKFTELKLRTANRTYPQIFIDNKLIGGFEDLLNYQFT